MQEQYEEAEATKEEMEKVRLEVTVMMTEKGQLRKELDRIERLYAQIKRDSREQRDKYE